MNGNSQQKSAFRLISHSTKLHSLLFDKTEAQKDQQTLKQQKDDKDRELQQKIRQNREDFKKVTKGCIEQQNDDRNCFLSLIQGGEKNSRKFEKKIKVNKTKNWSLQENQLYIQFLKQNANMFKYRSIKRVRQIFNLLSEKMGGQRTPTQCKSYHKKMKVATQNGTIKQIIWYICEKYQINESMHEKLEILGANGQGMNLEFEQKLMLTNCGIGEGI